MQTRKRTTQTKATSGGPWLTFEQLGARWGRNPKTIANLVARGTLPLRPVRLYDGADPLFHLGEVEDLEQSRLAAAGVALRSPSARGAR